jgi:uncharacterized DUF497 family protein
MVNHLKFEWDERKNKENQKKHGISFEEAKSVFYDDLAVEFFDSPHSKNEERFLMLGVSANLRVLMVSHCIRGQDNIIRIISARKATTKEKQFYPGGGS